MADANASGRLNSLHLRIIGLTSAVHFSSLDVWRFNSQENVRLEAQNKGRAKCIIEISTAMTEHQYIHTHQADVYFSDYPKCLEFFVRQIFYLPFAWKLLATFGLFSTLKVSA